MKPRVTDTTMQYIYILCVSVNPDRKRECIYIYIYIVCVCVCVCVNPDRNRLCIYIYIVIHRQTVSLYYKAAVFVFYFLCPGPDLRHKNNCLFLPVTVVSSYLFTDKPSL